MRRGSNKRFGIIAFFVSRKDDGYASDRSQLHDYLEGHENGDCIGTNKL